MLRFLDRLIEHMGFYVQLERGGKLGYRVPYYHEYLKRLRSPECKRILFDARQAALFDELDESPPPAVQRRIHPPFGMFYLEFTEPVLLGNQEPGQQDWARAILYTSEGLDQRKVRWTEIRFGGETYPVENAVLFLSTEGESPKGTLPYHQWQEPVPKGYKPSTTQFVDRAWTLRLVEGMALSRAIDARQTGSQIPEDWDDHSYFPACSEIPMFPAGREVSWWEKAIQSQTDLLSWICTYIMAKGIHVSMEPVSRQVRRWHERKGIPLPQPWHIVKVEPKFSSGPLTAHIEGSQHRYRYDVIGHLRFGRHRRGDGSYSETIEWIAPHQRGLANEIYIPKLYKVERGRVISPLMRRYYGETPATRKEKG